MSEVVFIRRVVIALALSGLVLLAWHLRALLLLVFGAVVVAVVLRSLAAPIQHHAKLPAWLSLTTAIVAIVCGLGAFLWFFGSEIGAEIGGLLKGLPQAWEQFEKRLQRNPIGERLLAAVAEAAPSGAGMLTRATGFVTSVGGGVADILVVIVGGIYFAADRTLYRRGLLKLLPAGKRDTVDDALGLSGRALGLWLKGQFISMIVIGFGVGLGLWIIGVPSAIALGLLAGILEFVPLVGPIVAAVPAVLLALTVGGEAALWTVLLFVAVEQAEGNILQPMVQRYAVELPPALFLFALLAFGFLFGIPGIIFAAPLTVVLYVGVKRLYVQQALRTETAIPGTR